MNFKSYARIYGERIQGEKSAINSTIVAQKKNKMGIKIHSLFSLSGICWLSSRNYVFNKRQSVKSLVRDVRVMGERSLKFCERKWETCAQTSLLHSRQWSCTIEFRRIFVISWRISWILFKSFDLNSILNHISQLFRQFSSKNAWNNFSLLPCMC
jgi:hypothetical protein